MPRVQVRKTLARVTLGSSSLQNSHCPQSPSRPDLAPRLLPCTANVASPLGGAAALALCLFLKAWYFFFPYLSCS